MIGKVELSASRGISNPPLPPHPIHSSPTSVRFQPLLFCKTHFHSLHNQALSGSGFRNSSLRSTTSEDISTGTTVVEKDELVEKKEGYDGGQLNEELQEGSLFDNPLKLFKFLGDLNIKLEYEETYSILTFGGGGAVVFWFVAAVVGAIDSIPVLPKFLELVGLGYSLWFSCRYLILKKNRDELLARVEQLKQQVLGSEED